MKIWTSLLFVSCFVVQLTAFNTSVQQILERFCPRDFEDLPISNWNQPTLDDFQLVENYLRNRQERIGDELKAKNFILQKELDGWISYRIGRTKIADGTEPKFIKVDFGNNPNARECCIVSYAGYAHGGRNYENGFITMIKALERLKFEGHLIYRVGGWPNLSKGRLHYADVPYAFKPFMFEEVKDMGYKYILWLDACCIPIRDLAPIFSHIKTHGYCYFNEGMEPYQKLQDWDYIRESLGAPKQLEYINVITQIVGISSFHHIGSFLLQEWIDAACKKLPFLNPSADQLCFSFLINKNNLNNGRLPDSIKHESYSESFELLNNKCIAYFYHNYRLLDSNLQPGSDFFDKLPLKPLP